MKLAKFIKTNYDANEIEKRFLSLVNSLVEIIEIIQISYSNFRNRNHRNILRLYNKCFTFVILFRNIFGNPAKLTSRNFFSEANFTAQQLFVSLKHTGFFVKDSSSLNKKKEVSVISDASNYKQQTDKLNMYLIMQWFTI